MKNDGSRRILDRIGVAAPCPAAWEDMVGDERVRFCGQCKLDVFNLAGMSAGEAENLLRRDGRVCVRFFRRPDGTVLTRDCPVGLRRRLMISAARIAAMAGALLVSLVSCGRRSVTPTPTPPQQVGPETPMLMGEAVLEPVEPPAATMGRVRPPDRSN